MSIILCRFPQASFSECLKQSPKGKRINLTSSLLFISHITANNALAKASYITHMQMTERAAKQRTNTSLTTYRVTHTCWAGI